MNKRLSIGSPQGLKPSIYAILDGAAEAAPFQNRFMR